MTKITFTGETYIAPGYEFAQPGEYEVEAEKAEQLTRDFPHLFHAAKQPDTATKDQDKPAKEPTKEQESKKK